MLVEGRKYEKRLEENKDVIKRYWDGKWNKRLPSTLDELQTPDVVYHSPSMNMNGVEEYKQVYGSYRAALHDTEVVIEEMIAEGDKVMTRIRLSGVHGGALGDIPASGNKFSCIDYTVFRLVDGKIAEEWELLDEHTFIQQLGATK
jgi:steroid delta-isomerase-like uncharacterized protein